MEDKTVYQIALEYYGQGGSYNDTVIIDDTIGWTAMTINEAVRRYSDRRSDIHFRLNCGGLFIGLEV